MRFSIRFRPDTLALALALAAAMSGESVLAQSAKQEGKPGTPSGQAEAPVDKTYRSKAPKFTIMAPPDKAWDVYADEASRKSFLVPAYKSRNVTFFHDIAGKKDMVEVSVTAIDKKDTDMSSFFNLYKGNLEDHFSDTKIFDVSEKAKFKGKKATSFKIEGRLKKSEGVVLVLESYLFEHKDFIMLYEVAADSPATREKYKKDLGDIEKSMRLM